MSKPSGVAFRLPGLALALTQALSLVLSLVLSLTPVVTAQAAAAEESRPGAITVVSDDNYPPYIFRGEDGAIQGILVDEWRAWERQTGIAVRLVATDWGKAQQIMQAGQADVIDTIFHNEERAKVYDFTKPYATLEVPVFVHKDLGGITDVQSLRGFTIGVKAGDAAIDVLKRQGIHTLKEYDSYLDIILAAKRHDLRVFSVDKPPALYYLYKLGLEGEFRSAFVLNTGQFHRAVKKGNTALLRLVENGFAAIPASERKAIDQKWLGTSLIRQEHLRFILLAGLGAAAVMLVLFSFNQVLRRKVRERTAELAASMGSLRESEERFRAIFNSVNDCIFIHDAATGRLVDVNSRTTEVFGYSREEILALDVGSLSSGVPPYSQQDALELMEKTRSQGPQSTVWRSKRKDGTLLWLNLSLRLATLGGQERVLVSSQDITEQRQALDRLRQSEEKFSRLFRLSPDSIILSDAATGRIVDVNEAFASTTGFARVEVIGKTARELGMLASPDALQGMYETLAKEGRVDNMEVELRYKDGRLAVCSLSSQTVDIGAESYRITIGRDMTEMKKMHEMMVQTEKMLSIGGIAAGIAHEINNPLGIVLQGAQTLAQRMDPKLRKNQVAAQEAGLDLEALQRYATSRKLALFLDDIQSAALRASGIIRNMLDFSRRSESHRTVCNLECIISKAVALAGSDYDLKQCYDFKRIEITRDVEDPNLAVSCTETEIEQVVLNLLRNAAQAMAMAKPPVARPRIHIRTATQDDRARIEITDNGPGMSPEVRRRAFEPFYTTKAPGVGTGLGLSVSYFIITKGHGGAMTVDSRPGEGARFVIELPISGAGATLGAVSKQGACT